LAGVVYPFWLPRPYSNHNRTGGFVFLFSPLFWGGMGEAFTNKSAVSVLFSAFKAAILFCFFRMISSLPRFFFHVFRVVVYNNNNDNNNSRNHIKEKGFLSNLQHYKFVFFFVLFYQVSLNLMRTILCTVELW
jgi:hypothetical protein